MSCFKSSNSVAEQKGNIVRRLGYMERYQAVMLRKKLYHRCVVSCRYVVPSGTQKPVKEILERAIAQTILDHPLMRVAVAGESSRKPVWVNLDTIDLAWHIEWLDLESDDDASYERAFGSWAGDRLNKPHTDVETRPGWTILVLLPVGAACRSVEVVLSSNHVAFDGMGSRIFHETLRLHLRGAVGKADDAQGVPLKDHVLYPPPLTKDTITPPQDQLVKYTITPLWGLSLVWKELLRPQFMAPRDPASASWLPYRRQPPLTTGSQIFRIGAPETAKILEACRKNGTTLTCLLQVLIFVSFCDRISLEQAPAFTTETPISLRRFVNNGPGVNADRLIANLITVHDYKFSTALVDRVRNQLTALKSESAEKGGELDKNIWTAASDFRADLVRKIDIVAKDDITGLMGLVGNWEDYCENVLKRERSASWSVTNIGTIEGRDGDQAEGGLDTDDAWSIQSSTFTQSPLVHGSGLIFCAVGVRGGSLTIASNWQIGVLDDDFAALVSNDLETRLGNLARSGRIVQ